MRNTDISISNLIQTGVRNPSARAANFRSNVIETLRWYCSEKNPDDISAALEQLFYSTSSCDMIRCEVIYLGEDSVPQMCGTSEADLNGLSATRTPFYSECSDNMSSLVQFCLDGSSVDGGQWQVRMQLAVRSDSEHVWETLLNDIISGSDESEDSSTTLEGSDEDTLDRLPGLIGGHGIEEPVDFTTLAHELVHELRNPLGAILTSVGLVKTKVNEPLDEEDRRLLEIVESETSRVDDTLGQFVKSMERLESTHSRLDIIEMLKAEMENSPLVRKSDAFSDDEQTPYDFGTAFIKADPAVIKSTLEYMVKRLPQSVKGCDSVNVTCTKMDNSIALGFEYGGIGIRPDLLRKVVLPFKSAKDGGSGLEAVPVQRVVSALDGTMSISSTESTTVVKMVMPLSN
jgi:hypothetical protein